MELKTELDVRPHADTRAVSPREQVMQMISGYWVSQICATVARLGLADQVVDGPRTVRELAGATSANPDGVGRLLRAAATVGLFAEIERDLFCLTSLGAELAERGPSGSCRDRAIALTAPGHWLPFARVYEAVVSGEPQATEALGMDMWSYYVHHPDEVASFARTMSSITAEAAEAVLRHFDATTFRRFVDVGGSEGILLAALLDAAPSARGVLFERPEVAQAARASVAASGHADRVDIVAGDFFREVPSGGDLYVLKSVLHDWDDRRALHILGNVHRAAEPGSRLVVIEMPLPSGPGGSFVHLLDLLMLVGLGGRERTVEDYSALLEQSGYLLERTTHTSGSAYPWAIMEAVHR